MSPQRTLWRDLRAIDRENAQPPPAGDAQTVEIAEDPHLGRPCHPLAETFFLGHAAEVVGGVVRAAEKFANARKIGGGGGADHRLQ